MTRSSSKTNFEWPTWLVLFGCYSLWFGAVISYSTVGLWALLPMVVCVALHSSLQHEALHGHPTRRAWLNEALIYPAIGLFVAYRRYKDTHLRHHNDTLLTDPYDDPESFYIAEGDYNRIAPWKRRLLAWNQTLVGRWVVGPPLSLFAFWSDELARIVRGGAGTRSAWIHHALGLVPVVAVLIYSGVPIGLYALAVAWPGMSLIMTRSFIEHRAVPIVGERTAIVEAGRIMSLIYLNNNLHAVHHREPTVAWYHLPGLWHTERNEMLADNGHYLIEDGYTGVFKKWALCRREPVIHPFCAGSRSKAYGACDPTPPSHVVCLGRELRRCYDQAHVIRRQSVCVDAQQRGQSCDCRAVESGAHPRPRETV